MTITKRMAVAFLVPAGLLLLAFLVVPAAWSLLQSFTNFTLLGPAARHLHATGVSNYVRALQDPAFWNSLRASLLYVAGSAIVGQVGCGLILALLTHQNAGALGGFVRGVAVTAWIIPTIVVAILWNVFLHAQGGTLNRMLGTHVDWLAAAPMVSLVLFNTWRGSAFSMLLFDAALRTIPASYYEAASVSGASSWRQFWDITWPLLRPQLLTDLLLITLWTFNDFSPYLLTGGGPGTQTEVLPIYTWRIAFRDFELGYGAALSTLLLIVNLVLALAYLRLLRKPQ